MPTVQDLRAALRQQGWRLTPQRKLILDAIMRSRGHISVDQVHRQVTQDFPDVNVTTVYRTLEVLETLGYVRHTHFHGDRAQYQRTDEPEHQHLVCTGCGKDQELDMSVLEPLEQELQRRYGFQADLSHTAFVGVCSRCQDKPSR
ncbi:MAG TPA: Fur family transcriptional regulator [Chloroflexota bacterium]|nr:Fur family transcriptional regulator [Chloroflexota bacterium]